MHRIIHVTHGDLDGIGCEILSRAAFDFSDHLTVFNEEYDTVNERIAGIIKENKFDMLFITDISPRDKKIIADLNELSKTKIIRLVDHHMTSSERFVGMDWARFTVDQCGALAFYHTLTNEFNKYLKRYYDFIVLVNDYDLWIKSDPMSDELNNLLQFLGKTKFVARTLNYNYEEQFYSIMPEEQIMAALYEDYIDRYVLEKISKAYMITTPLARIVVVYADMAASQIGEAVRSYPIFDDCHCTAIINMTNKVVSLRTIDQNFNVGKFAQTLGGGGNPATAGFEFDNSHTIKFMYPLFDIKETENGIS